MPEFDDLSTLSITNTSIITDKEVFLHVGLHKTASTFLQQSVFPNFKISDVSFNFGDNRTFLQKSRVWTHSGCTKDTSEQYRQYILSELSSVEQPKIVFSSEDFSGFPAQNHRNAERTALYLKRWFPNARIILTVRNQVDWLPSLYKEALRHNVTCESFNSFLNFYNGEFCPAEPRASRNVNALAFDWLHHIRIYQNLFGDGRIHVFFQEHLRNDRQAFLKTLEDTIGAPLEYNNIHKDRSNVGMSALSVILSAAIMRSPMSIPNKNRFKALLTHKYIARSKHLDWELLSGGKRKTLTEHYRKINEGLEPYFPSDEVRKYYL